MKIPFNKPYVREAELAHIKEAAGSGSLSGDGPFTKKCHSFFEKRYGFGKVLLTPSCTDALEMASILCGIGPGDEVIVPSYTFVSTANAFVLRGARVVFADCAEGNPNIDAGSIESLISPRTRVIVPVHYAGVACEMDVIMNIAVRHGIYVVEDSAQAVDAYFQGKPLGSIGHMGAFSFHETKNVVCGEGGLIAVNDRQFWSRSEIVREKGTNRSAFFRGDVDKYGWVDVGSSFLLGDMLAAFLYGQLEALDEIQSLRLAVWRHYAELLRPLADQGLFDLPAIPSYATNNGHMFYLVCRTADDRTALLDHLRRHEIMATFHYSPLHASPFFADQHDGRSLPHAVRFSECLIRLPLYCDLTRHDVERIASTIDEYFRSR